MSRFVRANRRDLFAYDRLKAIPARVGESLRRLRVLGWDRDHGVRQRRRAAN